MLSPRGNVKHVEACLWLSTEATTCSCVSRVRIYVGRFSCYNSIFVGRTVPKFAIADGNSIGYLPKDLNRMTYGSRTLIRPVQ